jgi:ubiquinol-cytochrome c reductase iron-sulfur subunit
MPGTMMTVASRGKLVFIFNLTRDMLAAVFKTDPTLADPQTEHPFSMPLATRCRNDYRSRPGHPNLLVIVGVCTHPFCTPFPRFHAGPQPGLQDDWPGVFVCPCRGTTSELAARVFKTNARRHRRARARRDLSALDAPVGPGTGKQ